MPPEDSPAPESADTAVKEGLPAMPPDQMEQVWADEIDNIVPTRGYQMVPMVGLGGSAGGIPAIREFLKKIPAESGLIFVVILHLSPEHESVLASLLARETQMKVFTATDGIKVET